MEKKLTIKQRRFADEYIISGNATEAAIKAGYNGKYVGQNADKLLKNTKVRAYIDTRVNKMSKSKILDAQERRELLTALAEDTFNSANDRIKAVDILNKTDATYVNRQEVKMMSLAQFVDNIESDLD